MAKMKKKELGKGIRALLSNADDTSSMENKDLIVKDLSMEALRIPLDQIETNPFQPRSEFDSGKLDELAASIRAVGVIQPITVRQLGTKKYQIISGERRYRASKIAGLESIPSYIRLADDQALLEMALVENIQRQDLNPMEIGISYQRLIEECELTHEELSGRVGKSRSSITNYMRLLKLPPTIQDALRKEKVSMGHARVLAGVEEADRQIYYFNKILENDLNVRDTEKMVRDQKTVKKEKQEDPYQDRINEMERALKSITGNKVKIKRKKNGKGSVTFYFASDRDLNEIFDRLLNT